MTADWRAVLESAGVRLRPLRGSDRTAWSRVRQSNVDWLSPWDATAPPGSSGQRPYTYAAMLRRMRSEARQGRQVPFAIEYEDRFVGQLTINNIVRGSAQFASVGYWIDQRYAGRGITTRAVAMAIDHAFFGMGLHRIEVAIRPENTASLRVVEKLGIPQVGYATRYLHIDGDWRDHLLFGITREDAPHGLLARLESQQSQE